MSAAYTKAQTGQDIRPGWEGNAIAKRLVARGVCTLSVALAVFSYRPEILAGVHIPKG